MKCQILSSVKNKEINFNICILFISAGSILSFEIQKRLSFACEKLTFTPFQFFERFNNQRGTMIYFLGLKTTKTSNVFRI